MTPRLALVTQRRFEDDYAYLHAWTGSAITALVGVLSVVLVDTWVGLAVVGVWATLQTARYYHRCARAGWGER